MKVCIFTEAGPEIGLGHIARCGALYSEVLRKGIPCILYIDSINPILHCCDPENIIYANWKRQEFIIDNVEASDLCIVDSYLAEDHVLAVISDISHRVLFIDDYFRSRYPKGVIVNPSLKIDREFYQTVDDKNLLLGSKYIILRESFQKLPKKIIKPIVENVLITMGGSDIRDLSSIIALNLCSKFPKLKFSIVYGQEQGKKLDWIPKEQDKLDIHYGLSSSEMKNIMTETDIAITAAGQTIYELIATQTPFLAIMVISNQKENISGLNQLCPIVDTYNYDPTVLSKLENGFIRLLDSKLRKEISDFFYGMIDGSGPFRIINHLLSEN